MKELIFFLLGMFTYIVIIPILSTLVDVILQSLEVLKGISTKKVSDINNAIQKQETKIETHCYGFAANSQEDEDDGDDYDDD
jgi:CRISPR/Cas system-associated protein Csm6